jgi:hypothetical protein
MTLRPAAPADGAPASVTESAGTIRFGFLEFEDRRPTRIGAGGASPSREAKTRITAMSQAR